MYLECRHIHPSGESCHAAALKTAEFCYYHERFHERQRHLRSQRRNRDAASGRFLQTPARGADRALDRKALPAPQGSAQATPHDTAAATYDYGVLPVGPPSTSQPSGPTDLPLELTNVEDAASVQLALMDVLQALARQELDPKRAGLLLYGLQVASGNCRNLRLHKTSVRELSYSNDGVPLAPEEYGLDIEDYNAMSDDETLDPEYDGDDDDTEDELT